MTGTSALADGPLTVLDLTRHAASRGLLATARRRGYRTDLQLLPTDLSPGPDQYIDRHQQPAVQPWRPPNMTRLTGTVAEPAALRHRDPAVIRPRRPE